MIVSVITIGFDSLGLIMRNASILDNFSTTKNSRIQATGHMITISMECKQNTSLVIPPMFNEIL